MLRVRLGRINFIGAERMGHEGFIIKPGGWKGWDSGPGTRGQRIDIPQGDGQFDLPVFRSGRIVLISGTAVTDSLAKLTHMGDQFTGLLADGAGLLAVDQGDVTRWAMVRLGDTPEFIPSVNGRVFRAAFTLQVWAPNPLKFGVSRTFGGGRAASHYGNTAAAPVLTVSGSMAAGYTITGPGGRQFIVTAPLVAGVPHRIDMRSGYLYIGGVLTFGAVARADVWGIPAGGTVVHSLSGSGSGVLSTSVTDTFV